MSTPVSSSLHTDKFEDNLRCKFFWRPKGVELCFGIQHYAGPVRGTKVRGPKNDKRFVSKLLASSLLILIIIPKCPQWCRVQMWWPMELPQASCLEGWPRADSSLDRKCTAAFAGVRGKCSHSEVIGMECGWHRIVENTLVSMDHWKCPAKGRNPTHPAVFLPHKLELPLFLYHVSVSVQVPEADWWLI